VATRPTQVVVISFDAFLTALKHSPKLTENFIGMMLDRVRFSGRYVEKAIEWSQAIAEGDYRAVERQIEAAQTAQDNSNQVNETRIESLLSAFFKMVEGVKRREDYMKKQLEQQFEIHIDAGKKDEEVENLAKRTFFYRVKTMADQMRARRQQRTDRDE
jgi:CRP-like cAMP-binding protein